MDEPAGGGGGGAKRGSGCTERMTRGFSEKDDDGLGVLSMRVGFERDRQKVPTVSLLIGQTRQRFTKGLQGGRRQEAGDRRQEAGRRVARLGHGSGVMGHGPELIVLVLAADGGASVFSASSC